VAATRRFVTGKNAYIFGVGVETTSQSGPPGPSPRQSPWQIVREAPATTALFAVCVVVYLAALKLGNSTSNATLTKLGADNRYLVWGGDYWRLVTSMFVHIGPLHIFANVYFGFRICALAEKQLGVPRFLLLYLGSGIVGSAVSVIGQEAVSAGASGALFGVIGWILVTLRVRAGSWRAFVESPPIRQQLLWIAAWFVIGIYAHFDNYAHGGGLLFGGLYTWALAAGPEPRKRRRRMAVALGVGLLLVAAALRPLPVVHASAVALHKAEAASDPNTVLSLTEPLLGKSAYREQALDLRVLALIDLNRFKEAWLAGEELVNENPKSARARVLRGEALHFLGSDDAAAADFDKAVELDPSEWTTKARAWFWSASGRQPPSR